MDRTEGGRCALEGTRTPNLLIRSQMLYPLSYERIAVWLKTTLRARPRNDKLADGACITSIVHCGLIQAIYSYFSLPVNDRNHIKKEPRTTVARFSRPENGARGTLSTRSRRDLSQMCRTGSHERGREGVFVMFSFPFRACAEYKRKIKGPSAHPAAHPYPCCLPALGRFR